MHVFLTGPKGVGKSTLLQTVLASFHGSVGGFRTVRLNTFLPGQYTVHLLPPVGNGIPREDNLLFVCGRAGADVSQRFERLGCEALEKSKEADMIIMDELGPHETDAPCFQRSVRKVLDGNVPVLGVLQQADSVFLREVSSHPHVRVIEVTEENRNHLAMELQR